jgi:hypothetical protein
MRSTLGTVLTAGALLLVAAPASAAVRYAEPNGDGPAASCPQSNPCSATDAVEDVSVEDGDEVILLPGTYSLASQLDVDDDIELRGSSDSPPPLLTANGKALDVTAAAHVHDLRAHSQTAEAFEAFVSEPVAERLILTSGTGDACRNPPVAPGVLRDSVCFTPAAGHAAILVNIGGSGTEEYPLRNVTAIATGTSSSGISFTNAALNITVDARNVIADGTQTDVFASLNTGSLAMDFAYSNYVTTNASGGASITQAGAANNQTAPYELADLAGGDFHQLPGSPTIDAGTAEDSLLGELDFEGQARVDGLAPDIGADEFDAGLKLKVKAKKRQKAGKLKVKVSCPHCDVVAKGKVKAGGESFKLKRKRRFVEAGERRKLKLKAQDLDQLEDLLEDGDGKAKINVKGTDAAGETARKKLRVTLTG